MKPNLFTVCPGLVFCGLLFCVNALAEDGPPVDRVTKKAGETLAVRGGKTVKLENNITFPGDIKVTTNGTFQVQQGKERVLKNGQVLSKDGTLTSPDGSVVPVMDHVVMKNGRIVMVKDGDASPLNADTTLADGTRVSPDGTLVSPGGNRSQLLDGQLYKLNGIALPAVDTVTLQGGKVIVQKDGSLLPVPAGRNIMMSEGTKVFGDGTVVKRDGTTVKLTEGQIVTMEGVQRRGK